MREDTPLSQALVRLPSDSHPVIVVTGMVARPHQCLLPPLPPKPRTGALVVPTQQYARRETPDTPSHAQAHLSPLTPEPPSYSQSARRKRMAGGGCVRCHPASADGWAGAAPRRCSAAPPR